MQNTPNSNRPPQNRAPQNNQAQAINRTSREYETRDVTERAKPWRPAGALPNLIAPAGCRVRWVRTSIAGTNDARNLSKKQEEGWVPLDPSTNPQLEHLNKGGVLAVSDMVAYVLPLERVRAREEYYYGITNAQTKSVEHSLERDSDPSMPVYNESRSKVSFGNGN